MLILITNAVKDQGRAPKTIYWSDEEAHAALLALGLLSVRLRRQGNRGTISEGENFYDENAEGSHGFGDFDRNQFGMLSTERQGSMESNTDVQFSPYFRRFGSVTSVYRPRRAPFRVVLFTMVVALLSTLSSLVIAAPANALPINKTPCDGRKDLAHVVMHFWGQAEEHCYANDGAMNVSWPDVTYVSSGNNYLKVDAPGQQNLCLSPWNYWTNGSARPLQVKYIELSRSSIPC